MRPVLTFERKRTEVNLRTEGERTQRSRETDRHAHKESERDRETETDTKRSTEGKRDRETERERERKRDWERETDKQTDRGRKRQTGRERHRERQRASCGPYQPNGRAASWSRGCAFLRGLAKAQRVACSCQRRVTSCEARLYPSYVVLSSIRKGWLRILIHTQTASVCRWVTIPRPTTPF